MTKSFKDLLDISKNNVEANPLITEKGTPEVLQRYLDALIGEVEEVTDELRPDNSVHLEDELSDIAWVYSNLLSLCEKRGLIDSAEGVISHAHKKYTERTPAFLEGSSELWESIKVDQKLELTKRHTERYGKGN